MPSFRLPNNPSHPFFSGKPSPDPNQYSTGPPSIDGRSSLKKARRKTATDTAVSRLADFERGASVDIQSDGQAGLSLKSKPSWMKRLSAVPSHDISPSPSPRADSPDTFSHTLSPTLSNNGSLAPFIASSTAPSLPPNKLVKRSTSQRFSESANLSSKFGSLRRPATSHQRSYTLQDVHKPPASAASTETEACSPEEKSFTALQPKWKHFFTIKASDPSLTSRKRSLHGGANPMKRISPEAGCIPYLIPAKRVLEASMEVVEVYDHDDASLFAPSRPTSAYFGSHAFAPPEDLRSQIANVGPGEEDLEPRKSFSLSRVLSRSSSKRKSPSQSTTARRASRQPARRVFSDPLAGLGIRSSTDVERPAKRRDLTDSHLLRANGVGLDPILNIVTDRQVDEDTLAQLTAATYEGRHGSAMTAHENSTNVDLAVDSLSKLSLEKSSVVSDDSSRSRSAVSAVDNAASSHGQQRLSVAPRLLSTSHTPDLVRPRGTRNHSGNLVSQFDTIYDESPPHKQARTPIREKLQPLHYNNAQSGVTLEDDDNAATPGAQTIRSDRADDGSPVARRLKVRAQTRGPIPPPLQLPSSPPDLSKALNLGQLAYDDDAPGESQKEGWSVFDEDNSDADSSDDWAAVEQVATPLAFKRSNPLVVGATSQFGSSTSTFGSSENESARRTLKSDLKSSIFDWSEQQSDKSVGNGSPPRPRTVHGKKVMDGRGGRATGRRVPSGLHVRSQSVPVVPDLAGKRETVVTNKFGTWGVGSKGVSEDWNDDFDFDEGNDDGQDERGERRIDSGVAMRIPQLIREHQVNVVNNIGLVREFGLLVEELKSLRIQALKLDLLGTPRSDVWSEIEAMIDLADQEADDPLAPQRLSPPSSPGFNSEAFDESNDASLSETVPEAAPTPFPEFRSKRKSLLQDNIFESAAISGSTASPSNMLSTTTTTLAVNRPRKDSEAMARSVIEALKGRTNGEKQPLALEPVPKSKKVPFDTNTLRHIVPYVNGLVREVKRQIRQAENLRLSPDTDTVRVTQTKSRSMPHFSGDSAGPPLSQLFHRPPNSTSARDFAEEDEDFEEGFEFED